MHISDRFEGCIIGGAIGDAWGSSVENKKKEAENVAYLFGRPKQKTADWAITDDTQLILATCESIIGNNISPEILGTNFIRYYKERKLTSIGSSTLKAIRELEIGGHWSQVGRTGEFAAGNGAAMRIAPVAFLKNVSRKLIEDLVKITHRNDEAYVGALCVVLSIREILQNNWMGETNLLVMLIEQIPDTRIRDRLIEINSMKNSATIAEVSKIGNTGYVVDSIPFAIFSATQMPRIGLTKMYEEIILSGGDTDTNASIAGQIAGALTGIHNLPINLINKLKELNDFNWIKRIIEETKKQIS